MQTWIASNFCSSMKIDCVKKTAGSQYIMGNYVGEALQTSYASHTCNWHVDTVAGGQQVCYLKGDRRCVANISHIHISISLHPRQTGSQTLSAGLRIYVEFLKSKMCSVLCGSCSIDNYMIAFDKL